MDPTHYPFEWRRRNEPGPDSVEGSTDSVSSSSFSSFETLTNRLSILHINIQSIVPKSLRSHVSFSLTVQDTRPLERDMFLTI